MRLFVSTSIAVCLLASAALAQGAPAQTGPANAAVKSPTQNNASAPVAGNNSFTMNQARTQIQAKGYTNITALTMDANGVWRGTATKDGKTMSVSVDYQGNVN